jgi:hypothetical protein
MKKIIVTCYSHLFDTKGEKIIVSKNKNEVDIDLFRLSYLDKESLTKSDEIKKIDKYITKNLEEVVIDSAFQFIKTQSDLKIKLFNDFNTEFLKEHKKLKNIIFSFNDKIFITSNWNDDLDIFEHRFFSNLTDEWDILDHQVFTKLILKTLEHHESLKIIIRYPELIKKTLKHKKISEFIRLFHLFLILNDNKKYKGRFLIDGLNYKQIEKIYNDYLLNVADRIVVYQDDIGLTQSKIFQDIQFLNYWDLDGDLRNSVSFNENTETLFFESQNDKKYKLKKEAKGFNKLLNWLEGSISGIYEYWPSINLNYVYSRYLEKSLIFVKKSYLDKTKKIIFKNIEHIWFYNLYDYSKLDNDQKKFKIPNSVKFNKLKTLHIYGGHDVDLENLNSLFDCSKLEELVLCECVGNKRTLPKLPNLKNFVFFDRFISNCEDFKEFKNLPNIQNLILTDRYNRVEGIEDVSKWSFAEFDSRDLKVLKQLDFLKIDCIRHVHLSELKILTSLTNLDLALEPANSDDEIYDRSIENKDFEFLQNLKLLNKLRIILPKLNSNVNGVELLKYVNKSITEVDLTIFYSDEEFYKADQLIDYINNNFHSLKKLNLNIFHSDHFELVGKDKDQVYFRKTGETWKSHEGPRQYTFDFEKLADLKDLELFGFNFEMYYDEMGFKIKNFEMVPKMEKLRKIKIHDFYINTDTLSKASDLTNKIANDFLEKCKKKNPSIQTHNDLPKREKAEYFRLSELKVAILDSAYNTHHAQHDTHYFLDINKIIKNRMVKKLN